MTHTIFLVIIGASVVAVGCAALVIFGNKNKKK